MTFRPVFERGVRLSGKNAPLEWARAGHRHPKALIFAPPLIGGAAAQQMRIYRPLIRGGYDLFSFSYSGHGISGGRFSLAASIRDTRHALFHAAAEARRRKIPLFGLAASYSAIPLLSAGRMKPPPFSKLVLINPVTRLCPFSVLRSFWSFCRRQPQGAPFQAKPPNPLKTYLNSLFPGIGKGLNRFGTLRRSRARLLKILVEASLQNPLSGVTLARTPALCLYGRQDDVLRIFHPEMGQDYEPAIRTICPHACFQAYPGGHFLRSLKARAVVEESILYFLARGECQT
ncbi:MAG: hypothetical protein K9L59_15455 [Desulfobacterales bacterium]|nr:hypothetical protein [Desulfobacterales bacterium]